MESINIVDVLVNAFKGESGENCLVCASDVLTIIISSISPLLQKLERKEIIAQLLAYSFDPNVFFFFYFTLCKNSFFIYF